MRAVLQVLLLSAEEQEQDRLLDVVRAVDARREGLGQEVENVASFRELVDVPDVRVGEHGLGDAAALLGREENDIVGDD